MVKLPDLTVGVLSDTHLPYRMSALPPIVFDIFKDVDLILHAGDVDNIEYLAALQDIAPLHAVRGNIHVTDLSWGGRELPETVQLTLASYKVLVVHGHRPGLIGWVTKAWELFLTAYPSLTNSRQTLNDRIARRIKWQYPEVDIAIFGHTHVAYCQYVGKTLFFNPGGVVQDRYKMRSVGLLRLWPDKVEPKIIQIDD